MSSKTKTCCSVCQKTFSSESELFKHNLTWEHRSKLETSSGSKTDASSSSSKPGPDPPLLGKTKRPTDHLSSQSKLSRADTTSDIHVEHSNKPPGHQQQTSRVPLGDGPPPPFQPPFFTGFRHRPFPLPPPPPPFPPPFPLPSNTMSGPGPHPRYGPRPLIRPGLPPRPIPGDLPFPFRPLLPPFPRYCSPKRFQPPHTQGNVPLTTQGQRPQAKSSPSPSDPHSETSTQTPRSGHVQPQPKAALKDAGSRDKSVHVGVQTERRKKDSLEGSKSHVQKSRTVSVPRDAPKKTDQHALHKDIRANAPRSFKQSHPAVNTGGKKKHFSTGAKKPQGGEMHPTPRVKPKFVGPSNREGVPSSQKNIQVVVTHRGQKPLRRGHQGGQQAAPPHTAMQKRSQGGEKARTDHKPSHRATDHHSSPSVSTAPPSHASGSRKGGVSPYKHVTKIIRDKTPKLIPPEKTRKSHTVKPLESLEFLPLEMSEKDMEVRDEASVSQEPVPQSSLQLPPSKSGGEVLLFGDVLQMEGEVKSETNETSGTLSSKQDARDKHRTELEETDDASQRATAEPHAESLYESISSVDTSDTEGAVASVDNSKEVPKQLNTAFTPLAVSDEAIQGPQTSTASSEETVQQTMPEERAKDLALSPDSSHQPETSKLNQTSSLPCAPSGVALSTGASRGGKSTPVPGVLPPTTDRSPTPPLDESGGRSSPAVSVPPSSSDAVHHSQLSPSRPSTAQIQLQALAPTAVTSHLHVALPFSSFEPADEVLPPAGNKELELLQKKIESESAKPKTLGSKAVEDGSKLPTTASTANEPSLKVQNVCHDVSDTEKGILSSQKKTGSYDALGHTALQTPPQPLSLTSQGKVTSSPRLESIVHGLKLKSLSSMPQPSTETEAQEGAGSFRKTRRGERKRKHKRNTSQPHDNGWHRKKGTGSTDGPAPKKHKTRHKSEGVEYTLMPTTDRGAEVVSDGESMSVSSSQLLSPQHIDRSSLLTPHMKFAADIAALNKRDKELQESLFEVQVQLGKMHSGVQESERKLMELQSQEKQLRDQRVGLAEQYNKILMEKQSLFSTPTSSSETSQNAGGIAGLNFFSKLKTLSEREQELQAQLLQGSQLLEEVSSQRCCEETRLAELKREMQTIEQDKFSLLMKDYQDIQRQKQELVVQWNTPTPSGQQELNGVLPVESTVSQPGGAGTSTATRPILNEDPIDAMATEAGSKETSESPTIHVPLLPASLKVDPQRVISSSEIGLYPETKPEPHLHVPPPTDDATLTELPPKNLSRTSASSSECNPLPPMLSEPTSKVHVIPEIQGPSPKAPMLIDHTAYSQACPAPSHTSACTEPPSPPSVTQSLAGTNRTMLTPIQMSSADENEIHPDSLTHPSSHPVAESVVSQPACTSSVDASLTPHHSPSVDSVGDSQPNKSADISPPLGSQGSSSKRPSIKLAWQAALAMSSACKEEPEHIPQSCSETDLEECSEEQVEPELDHTGFITFLHPHESSVLGIKISENHLYTCSSDKTVKIYDIQTCKEVQQYSNHKRSVTCLEVLRYGNKTYIVTGSSDKHIIMCDANTGEVQLKFHVGSRVMYMASQDTLLVAGLSNGFVHVIDLQKQVSLGKSLCHMETRGKKDITCLCIDGTSLFTASHDNTVICWDISDYTVHPPLPAATMRRCYCMSSFKNIVLCMQVCNERVYCGSADATLRVFNTKTCEEVGVVTCHGGAISSLSLMGEVLITSCFDRFVRCFDSTSLQLLQLYGRLPNLPFTQCCANGMVYSGLKNGEVKAIEIDLTHFYQCQWSECALKFGVQEHLKQHLAEHLSCDEGSSIRCKWEHCNATVQHNMVSKHVNIHLIKREEE